MKSTMYENENHLMICTQYKDPEMHQHSAAHIIISLEGNMEVSLSDKTILCEGILIPSGMFHTANTYGKRVLVFLFDKTTTVSNQIDVLKIMNNDTVNKIRKAFMEFESCNISTSSYLVFLRCVFESNEIHANTTIITDERIQKSMTYIQSKLHEKLSCREVADHVFLSTGRFSHLFKEQAGMTFAAYLIYQRVIKVYTDIINGNSVTNAALDAGFSSSAHFAEVNKRLFGLSATGVTKELQFYKIAEI